MRLSQHLRLVSIAIGSSSLVGGSVALCAEQQPLSNPVQPLPPQKENKLLDLEVGLALLYWRTSVPNLTYAGYQNSFSNDPAAFSNLVTTFRGKLERVHYDTDLGYRVALGYNIGPRWFQIAASYTHLHTTGSDKVNERPGDTFFLQPTFATANQPANTGSTPNTFNPTDYSSAKSTLSLHYNVVDLDGIYAFYKARHAELSLLFGGKGAWIFQNWNTTYFTSNVVTVGLPFSPTYVVDNKWSFAGGGPLIGLNAKFLPGWGFDLHFQGDVAVLFGSYKISYLSEATSPQSIIGQAHPKDMRAIPAYQFFAGLGWRKSWSKVALRLYADWEINDWIDLHQHLYYNIVAGNFPLSGSWVSENVVLQGLTAGINLDF